MQMYAILALEFLVGSLEIAKIYCNLANQAFALPNTGNSSNKVQRALTEER